MLHSNSNLVKFPMKKKEQQRCVFRQKYIILFTPYLLFIRNLLRNKKMKQLIDKK